MNDVDVNILIQNYHSKVATLYNQNVLLESKIQSIIQEFSQEKELLLMKTLELQKEIERLSKKSQRKQNSDDFIESEV